MPTPTRISTTILITGFGPFPGMPKNPSQTLAFELAERAQGNWPDCSFITHIFATNWKSSEPELHELYEMHDPAVVLHFGVGNQKSALHIERRARNHASSDLDADDCAGCNGPIEGTGPVEMKTRLALYPLLKELRANGINTHLSNNAGSYLCNYLYYNSLIKAADKQHAPMVTFAHLPTSICAANQSASPQNFANNTSRLSWTNLIDAGMILISHGINNARINN